MLASIWYEGLPGFRRRNIIFQTIQLAIIGALFPVLSIAYILAPHSVIGQFIKKPFIKFICHSASYVTFLCEPYQSRPDPDPTLTWFSPTLVLLMLASQRIETDLFGNTPGPDIVNTTKRCSGLPLNPIGAH